MRFPCLFLHSYLHNLKVLFVCENNNYSVYSRVNKRQNNRRNISKIANSIGIKSLKLKDHDLITIYKKSKKIINDIRNNNKPFFLEINTYRFLEHCGPNEDDNLVYRPKLEITKWKNNCQVNKYENILIKKKLLSKKYILNLKKNISNEINEAFEFSYKSKFPSKEYLNKFIYKKVF